MTPVEKEIIANTLWLARSDCRDLFSEPWKLVALRERIGPGAAHLQDCVTIYAVPDTGHWAGWQDVDAIRFHGEAVARNYHYGWDYCNQAAHAEVSETAAREFDSLADDE